MSEVIWTNDSGVLAAFTVDSIEAQVIGDCYVLTFKGGGEEIQIMMDESDVRQHNAATMEFIKGWTYNHLNGKA